jgi:hypothetical protein
MSDIMISDNPTMRAASGAIRIMEDVKINYGPAFKCAQVRVSQKDRFGDEEKLRASERDIKQASLLLASAAGTQKINQQQRRPLSLTCTPIINHLRVKLAPGGAREEKSL